MAVTDLPGPLSLPWLPVSGQLVSVWVSSCRPFVECTGRWRGGSVGVGVEDSRQSLWARALFSKLFTALHFTFPLAFDTLPVKIPLTVNSHSSLSSFHPMFFVLTPITHLLLLARFISLSFYFSPAALRFLSFFSCSCCSFHSLCLSHQCFSSFSFLNISPSNLTSHSLSQMVLPAERCSVSQTSSQVRPTECLPVRQLSMWTIIQTDFGLSLPVAEI